MIGRGAMLSGVFSRRRSLARRGLANGRSRKHYRPLMELLEVRRVLAFTVVDHAVQLPEGDTITLVDDGPGGAVWRYLDDGSNQGTAWRNPGFNDTSWAMGAGQLGFGDGDENTTIDRDFGHAGTSNITFYFRHTFSVTAGQLSQLDTLNFRYVRDDGLVLYLNGQEQFRDNMPAGTVTSSTPANSAIGGSDESTFQSQIIAADDLVVGTNVIAMEMHQNSSGSSDISFDLELLGNITPPGIIIEVDFSHPVDESTLDTSDMTVNGDPAVAFNVIDSDTIAWELPELIGLGPHDIAIAAGAFQSTVPEPIEEFLTDFELSPDPQYVVNHHPRIQPGNAPLIGTPAYTGFDQIDVLWQTMPGGSGVFDSFEVEYRLAGSGDEWMEASSNPQINTGFEGRVVHSASIEGLDWYTDYEYRVTHLRAGVEVQTWQHTFKTRLETGDDTPFSFAAYGDSAFVSSNGGFNSVQSRINAYDPAFSLLLGDTAYGSGSHFEFDARFDPDIAPPAAEWIASHVDYYGVGNHDALTAGGQPARDNFSVPIPEAGVNAYASLPAGEQPEHVYSFDYGDVHFVTFDTNVADNGNGSGALARLTRQLDYVVADLNASSATWKVVYGHHGLSGHTDKTQDPDDIYFQEVVSRLGEAGVDAFIAGHSHLYSWSFPITGFNDENGDNSIGEDEVDFIQDTDRDYDKGAGLIQVVSGVGGRSLRTNSFDAPYIVQGYSDNNSSTGPLPFGFTLVDVTSTQLSLSYIDAATGEIVGDTNGNGMGDPGETFFGKFTITGGPDEDAPTADLASPIDNGPLDTNLAEGELELRAAASFQIQLDDARSGINDSTVTPSSVNVTRDGAPLVEGVDYDFSYDTASDLITISPVGGGNFATGEYELEISPAASPIEDKADVPNTLPTTNFTIDIDISFPTPLESADPQGSLIFNGQVVEQLPGNDDSVQYSIDLTAGQVVNLVARPESGLQPKITLTPPTAGVQMASAAAEGEAAAITGYVAPETGTYLVTLSDALAEAPLQSEDLTASIALSPAVDTFISESSDGGPNASHGSALEMNWDLIADNGGVNQSMVYFDIDTDTLSDFLNTPGATAKLTLNINDPGNNGNLHRITADWLSLGDNVTWNNMPGGAGGIAPGTNAALGSVALPGSLGTHVIDVTSDVLAWASGTANFGWALLNSGTGGVSAQTVESGNGPVLSLNFPIPTSEAEAFTEFNEPALGASSYVAGSGGSQEIGFTTSGSIGSSAGVASFSGNAQYLVHSSNVTVTTDWVDVSNLIDILVGIDVRTWEDSSGSDFEGEDSLRVYVEADAGGSTTQIDLVPLTTGGSPDSLKALDNGQFGAFTNFSVGLDDGLYERVRVVIQAANNSPSERFMFDNIAVFGDGSRSVELEISMNTAVEAESVGGASNDSSATAQDLDPSFAAIGSGSAQRAAVLGTTESGGSDVYSFTLAADQSVTIVATGQEGAAIDGLMLEDAGGTWLAIGTPGSNVGRAIHNFTDEPGTYYVRVVGTDLNDYSLLVLLDADFDTEENSSVGTAQNISGPGSALGAIATAGDVDFYSLEAEQDDTLTVSITTPDLGDPAAANDLTPVVQLLGDDDSLISSDFFADFPSGEISGLAAGSYKLGVQGASGTSGDYLLETVITPAEIVATIEGRHIFYNNSFFDNP
ncbi:MAG: DNRLRE domain-containing protein, partial [Pirellulales bacterium]